MNELKTLEKHPSYPERNLTPVPWEKGQDIPIHPYFDGKKTLKKDASQSWFGSFEAIQRIAPWFRLHKPGAMKKIFGLFEGLEMEGWHNVHHLDDCTLDVAVTERGLPLNPWGDYHLEGRGELRHFGPQIAVDVIPFIRTPDGEPNLVMVLRRNDDETESYAFCGGFIEMDGSKFESIREAAARELSEETGGSIDVSANKIRDLIHLMPCKEDPRTTNNAWIYTNLCAVELPGGTTGAEFVPLTYDLVSKMWCHHKDLLEHFLEMEIA